MAINKVTYSGNTLIDLTADTVDAEHLAEGYTAHNAAGAIITGTMTGGGGGGLPPFTDVETGTWSPSADIARPTISFSNSHSAPPAIVVMSDATGTAYSTTASNMSFTLIDNEKLSAKFPYSSSATRAASYYYVYRNTSTSSVSVGGGTITNGSSNTGTSSTSYFRYFATASAIYPYSNSTSRYWRTGRTYKWFALWL